MTMKLRAALLEAITSLNRTGTAPTAGLRSHSTLAPASRAMAFTRAMSRSSPPLSGALPGTAAAASWPTANGPRAVPATIKVTGTFDGGMKRFYGTGGQDEDQGSIFELAAG
ncbi:MAG TPA: hypothetical protein VJT49_04610 [Amycolatopsis sp.]|uniref:hypothetical protein n=1 Tax=Amycolatopsis sp. TaxID=37632 RepID=UPI002B47F075|nr:hypothetical protein [Amycolatopsis sp.]HKS44391.1 hypothetical protein [Amycolatopsis sp.]